MNPSDYELQVSTLLCDYYWKAPAPQTSPGIDSSRSLGYSWPHWRPRAHHILSRALWTSHSPSIKVVGQTVVGGAEQTSAHIAFHKEI